MYQKLKKIFRIFLDNGIYDTSRLYFKKLLMGIRYQRVKKLFAASTKGLIDNMDSLEHIKISMNEIEIKSKLVPFKMTFDKSNTLYRGFEINGLNDVLETQIINKLQLSGSAIDCGANTGYYSLLLAKNFDLTVYSFEPDTNFRRYLNKNISINNLQNKIFVESSAVGIKDDELKLVNGVPLHENNKTGHVTIVNQTCIDNYLKKHNITDLSFIKIDVEGLETDVVLGAKNSIKTYSPYVLAEISPDMVNQLGKKDVSIIFDFFNELGYSYFYFDHIPDKNGIFRMNKGDNYKREFSRALNFLFVPDGIYLELDIFYSKKDVITYQNL